MEENKSYLAKFRTYHKWKGQQTPYRPQSITEPATNDLYFYKTTSFDLDAIEIISVCYYLNACVIHAIIMFLTRGKIGSQA